MPRDAVPDRGAAPGGRAPPPRWTLVVAIVLTALNLRTAVTSVGPLLGEVQAGHGAQQRARRRADDPAGGVLRRSSAGTPRRSPPGWASTGRSASALALMTVGLVGRSLVDAPAPFLALSGVALFGGAVGNVLLPSLVKRHFPDRIGAMTAVYTTALAIGLTGAAAGAVPLARAVGDGGWRFGLGAWALLSGRRRGAVAAPPGATPAGGARAAPTARAAAPGCCAAATAWALALLRRPVAARLRLVRLVRAVLPRAGRRSRRRTPACWWPSSPACRSRSRPSCRRSRRACARSGRWSCCTPSATSSPTPGCCTAPRGRGVAVGGARRHRLRLVPARADHDRAARRGRRT